MPRRQKKYHYIYKTTCKVTGKFYVGMHSTDNLDDGYLGSGKILGYSRKKYGDENHTREILEMLPSREALKAREKEIVNEALLADSLNINLKYGGDGGWDHIKTLPGYKKQLELAGKNGGFSNQHLWSQQTKQRVSKKQSTAGKITMQTLHTNRKDEMRIFLNNATCAAKKPSAIEKRKKTFAERKHSVGERNSQFGTCWVTNGTPIKIKKEQLDKYLSNGYYRGRKRTDLD